MAITKLDVLGELDSLKICTAYDYNGRQLNEFPASLDVLADCKPIYETLPGWPEDISGIKKFDELPQNVKNYLKRIEDLIQTPVSIVSVSPERDATMVLSNPFK